MSEYLVKSTERSESIMRGFVAQTYLPVKSQAPFLKVTMHETHHIQN